MATSCGSPSVQREADKTAAAFADTTLLRSLGEVARITPPAERVAAAVERLREPDEKLVVINAGASWVVGPVRGSTIDVTAYFNWEDKSFSASQAWGVACRQYTVSNEVTASPVECPEDTPPTPGRDAVGWDYR